MGNRITQFSGFLGKIHKRSNASSQQNLIQEEGDGISGQVTVAHSSGEPMFNDTSEETSSLPDLTCKVAELSNTSLPLEKPADFNSSFQKILPQPANRNKNMLLTPFPNIPAPPQIIKRKGKAVGSSSDRNKTESIRPPTPQLSTGRDQQTLQIWSQTLSVPPFSIREDKSSGQLPQPIRIEQEWSSESFQNMQFLQLANITEELLSQNVHQQPSSEEESIFPSSFYTILPSKHFNTEDESSSAAFYTFLPPLPSNAEQKLMPLSLQTITALQPTGQKLELELSPPSNLSSKLDISMQSSLHFKPPVEFTSREFQSFKTFPTPLTRREQESFQSVTHLTSRDKAFFQINLPAVVSNKEQELLQTIPPTTLPFKEDESLQTNSPTAIPSKEQELLKTITSFPVSTRDQESLQAIPPIALPSKEQESLKNNPPSPIYGREQESLQTLLPLAVSSQEQELLQTIPASTVSNKEQELFLGSSQTSQSSQKMVQENLLHSSKLSNIIPPELTSKEEKYSTKTLHKTSKSEELTSITALNVVQPPVEGRSSQRTQRGPFHWKGKEEEREPLEQFQPILKDECTQVNVCIEQITPILTNLAESASKMTETLAVLSEHQANIATSLQVLTKCQILYMQEEQEGVS